MRATRLGLLVGIVFLLGAAPSARAVERCKARVDVRTGVVAVSAKSVVGPLTWTDRVGGPPHPFFDAACVADGKAKGCLLDDPASLAARTPPAGCTLVLADTSGSCAAPVPGCAPAVRPLDLPRTIVGTWALSGGGTISFDANGGFATSEGSTGTYRTVGNSILLDIDGVAGDLNGVLTYLGTLPNGELIFAQENALGLTRIP